MNREARTPESRAEDLDALLGAFYRAEMPAPWPAFREPARTRLAPVFTAWSSRLALVAAVALLLLGAWMLPGPSGQGSAERARDLLRLSEPTATPPHGLDKGNAPAKPRLRNGEKGKNTAAPGR